MAELPSREWTVDQYLEWMKRGFEYLHFQWEEQGDAEEVPWDTVCKDDFLTTLDVTESQVRSTPQLRGLDLFLTYVDDKLGDEEERRAALLDPTRQRQIVQECLGEMWQEWQTAPPPPAPVPPDRPESFSWVSKEQRDQLGSDWKAVVLRHCDKEYPQWRQQTDLGALTRWLTGWLPVLVGAAPRAPVPPDRPESFSWVTSEQRTRLGADWKTFLQRNLDKEYPGWKQQTDLAVLRNWLGGWWNELMRRNGGTKIGAQRAPAPKAQPSAQQAKQIVGELASSILASRKDLAGQVSDAEFQGIVAEVLAERAAARGA